VEEKRLPFLFFLSGLSFSLFHFSWLLPYGFFPWFLLSLTQSFFWALFGFLFKKFKNPFHCAFLWAGIEVLKSLGPWGFSWGTLGYTQTGTLLGKIANYFGVFGVSFLILGTSISIYYLTLGKRKFEKYKLISIIFLLLLILSLVSMFFKLKLSTDALDELRVTLIQPNIPQQRKLDSSRWKEVVKETLSLLPADFRERELIIFPETAYPDSYREGEDFFEILKSLAQSKGVSFLVGAYYEEKGKVFNSAFLITPQSIQRYDKVNIVPFGEYLPLRPYLGWLPYRYIGYRDLSSGSLKLLKNRDNTFGVGICFESGNPFLARKIASKGGETLIYITNDAWFDGTILPPQHFEITRMRAVETGVYTIQVANTGRSGIIDSKGEIVSALPLKEKDVLRGKIYLKERKSFFVKYGFCFNYASLVVILVSFCGYFWGRRRALTISLFRAL
jgi:apolipoprotein N-acyltransferase